MICPNCAKGHQPRDVCVVAVLLGVIEDRIDRQLTTEELDRVNDTFDVDGMWDDLGPWVDRLERLVLP